MTSDKIVSRQGRLSASSSEGSLHPNKILSYIADTRCMIYECLSMISVLAIQLE